MTITITLNEIRKHSPCEDGWQKLLKHLGKTKADDEPLKFSTVLKSNGVDDAYWCLRALPEEHHSKLRLLVCDCAERVLPIFERALPNDSRPRDCIETARKFTNNEATKEELAAARDAARAATRDAGDAAWAAAWAARAAAGDAEHKAQGKLLIKYFG